MRVLVTGFEWFGDLVPFVVRGLEGVANEVSALITKHDASISTRAGRIRKIDRIPVIGPSLAGRWRSTLAREQEQRVNLAFQRECERFQPDVVLSILCWGEPLTRNTIATARRATRIGWLMDDPFGFTNSRLEKLLDAFDCLYCPDEGWSDTIERMTGRRPVWLPCGADPQSHCAVGHAELDRSLADHVVYVGSSCADHPTGEYRRALLESLSDVPLAIFGDEGWRRYGGAVARAYRGGPVSSERANQIYASGAIALNLHHPQFRRGTSPRTFALCCSGAFQIADWRDGLDRWLTPGVELETFRTPRQLHDLVDRYLPDAAARARVAAAGQARVLAEHTYRHRLEAMLQARTEGFV
jgi:spore maturation protein CgeB